MKSDVEIINLGWVIIVHCNSGKAGHWLMDHRNYYDSFYWQNIGREDDFVLEPSRCGDLVRNMESDGLMVRECPTKNSKGEWTPPGPPIRSASNVKSSEG